MRWESLIKQVSAKNIIILMIFTLLYLGVRVPRLHNDVINPDGVNWHYRSQQFMNGLKYGDLAKTYQHYHPGVTLMWLTAPVIELYRQFPGNDSYNMYNFIGFHFLVKLTLVMVQLGVSLLIIYYLSKIIGFYKSILVMGLLSLEPFFVGNSRLYHMDVLLTLLIFLSLTVFYHALQSNSPKYYLFAGSLTGMAFLTKTISGLLLVYLLGYLAVKGIAGKKLKQYLFFSLILLGGFTVAVFLFFPALRVNPVFVIQNLFTEGVRVGVRKGHDVIVLGDEVNDGGIWFYPLVLLMKISPFLGVGFAAYIFEAIRRAITGLKSGTLYKYKTVFSDFSVLAGVFYLFYILVMLYPSKKLDRYMLVVFPLFAYGSAVWLTALYHRLARYRRAFIAGVALSFGFTVIYPLLYLFPYYFTYTSPLFGTGEQANRIIGQKPFGVAMYELKEHILNKYGYYPILAFVDIKPIESIYPNSRVVDIRETALEEYDLAVLGPNETFPMRVERSPFNLVKDSSIYINGLEYWRIYVKRPK